MQQIFTIVDDGKFYDENGNEIVQEQIENVGNENDIDDEEEEQEPIVLT
jgi:hypothetical protein